MLLESVTYIIQLYNHLFLNLFFEKYLEKEQESKIANQLFSLYSIESISLQFHLFEMIFVLFCIIHFSRSIYKTLFFTFTFLKERTNKKKLPHK